MPARQPDAAPTPVVVLSVRPRLLRDALTRLLSRDGVEVLVVPDDPSELALDVISRRYDIAVTSGGLPVGIDAGLVLLVAADGEPAPGVPPSRESTDVIDIANLGDVLDEVDRWRREHAIAVLPD